jgi:WXG100 family type VII secretion target
MPKADEPLQVNPAELRATAERLDGHAAGFIEALQSAQARAEAASLGRGAAAAALPEMLAAWEEQAVRFAAEFRRHSESHRSAATGYERTDELGAAEVGGAGSEM